MSLLDPANMVINNARTVTGQQEAVDQCHQQSTHTHTHSWMSVKGTCSMLQCTQGTCFHGQRPPGLGLETHDHETCIFIYAHALPSRAALTVTIYTRTSSSYLRQRLVWCMGEQVEVPNANHQPQQFSCRLLFNSIDARRRWC